MNYCKVVIIIALMASGCVQDERGAAQIGAHNQAVYDSNRILSNRILSNRLAAFSLSGSAIASAQLVDNTLTFNSAEGDDIETTPEGREVLDYITRCAFGPGTFLRVEYDGGTDEYEGIVGLATDWADRALTESEKSYISACLFAHVNHFGVSVNISLRFPNLVGAEGAEAAQYQVREGGFYGAYFVDSGDVQWYACQGDSETTALVNSDTRDQRVCTDQTSGCAIGTTGLCQDVCDAYKPGEGWSDCRGGDVIYHEVANVFLKAHDPDNQNEICGANNICIDGNALDSGNNHVAILDGSQTSATEARCGNDSVCVVNGAQSAHLAATIAMDAIADVACDSADSCSVMTESGADVEVDCRKAGTCTAWAANQVAMHVNCRGANTCSIKAMAAQDVSVDCTNTSSCTAIHCTSGSPCLLTCDPAGTAACEFSKCTDDTGLPVGVTLCDSGVWACNRACP